MASRPLRGGLRDGVDLIDGGGLTHRFPKHGFARPATGLQPLSDGRVTGLDEPFLRELPFVGGVLGADLAGYAPAGPGPPGTER